MGVTHFVECRIGFDHCRRDPGAAFRILRAGAGASDHYLAEAGVESDREMGATNRSVKTARNMQFHGEEDGTRVGRPPEDRLIVVVPGKDAVAVRLEQPLRLQIAADGEEAFRRGPFDRWKAQIVRVAAQSEHGVESTPCNAKKLPSRQPNRQPFLSSAWARSG